MDRKENQNFISTLLAAYKRLMCGSLEISDGFEPGYELQEGRFWRPVSLGRRRRGNGSSQTLRERKWKFNTKRSGEHCMFCLWVLNEGVRTFLQSVDLLLAETCAVPLQFPLQLEVKLSLVCVVPLSLLPPVSPSSSSSPHPPVPVLHTAVWSRETETGSSRLYRSFIRCCVHPDWRTQWW